MKGIKVALVGICVGLLGISMINNATPPSAVICAFVGVVIAIIGCFVKEK